jgi:hypothetical protein
MVVGNPFNFGIYFIHILCFTLSGDIGVGDTLLPVPLGTVSTRQQSANADNGIRQNSNSSRHRIGQT